MVEEMGYTVSVAVKDEKGENMPIKDRDMESQTYRGRGNQENVIQTLRVGVYSP